MIGRRAHAKWLGLAVAGALVTLLCMTHDEIVLTGDRHDASQALAVRRAHHSLGAPKCTVRGAVAGPSEEPVAGATVCATPLDRAVEFAHASCALSGLEGDYELSN